MKKAKEWAVNNIIELSILIILILLLLINTNTVSNMTKTNSLVNDITGLVTKLGGFTVVVGLICKFSVDYFMEKKTYKYKQEIEKLKHELSAEIEKSKSLNEQVSHKNKLLFDEEIIIYKKISPYVNDVKDSILSYIMNIDELKVDDVKEKAYMRNAKEKLDSLRGEWINNSFFMDEKVYSSLEDYLKKCFDALDKIAQKELSDYNIRSEIEMVINYYSELKTVIREYLIKKAELI